MSVADIARRNAHSKNSEGERIAAATTQSLATRSRRSHFKRSGEESNPKNEMHARILAFHM